MATTDGDILENWYKSSIGKPSTADEVYGYWLFALGILAGFVGIALVVASSSSGSTVRGAGIVLAALGLVVALVGQIVRLPLERSATAISVGGALVSAAGVVWFSVAFNTGNWGSAFAHSESLIIGLYGIGILVMAVGSVITPAVSGPRDKQAAAERRASEARTQRDEARANVERHERQDQKQETAVAEAEKKQAAAEKRAREAEASAEEARTQRDEARERIEQHERRNQQQATAVTEAEREQAAAEHRAGEAEAERDVAVAETARLVAADEERADSQSQFELFTDKGGEARWRLRHANGNIIADSAEGYSSRQKAMQGLDAVRRDATGATVLDLDKRTEESDEPNEETETADDDTGAANDGQDEGTETADDEPVPSQSTFELYTDAGDEFRWRLRHDNGNIISDGSEGYSSRQAAVQGIDAVKRDVAEAAVLDLDKMDGEERPEDTTDSQSRAELYTDTGGEFRWRLRHTNGNIIADSAEGYSSRQKAMQGLDAVKRDAPEATVLDLEETNDPESESGDGAEADSSGTPDDRTRDESVESQSEFELYTDASDEFRWRLRHTNGNIIADGSEGYASRQNAMQGLDAVKRDAAEATVLDLDRTEKGDRPDDPGDSQSRFELYTDAGDEFRWRLRHTNGNIIADSAEGYTSRQKAMQGLDAVKRDAAEATVLDPDEAE